MSRLQLIVLFFCAHSPVLINPIGPKEGPRTFHVHFFRSCPNRLTPPYSLFLHEHLQGSTGAISDSTGLSFVHVQPCGFAETNGAQSQKARGRAVFGRGRAGGDGKVLARPITLRCGSLQHNMSVLMVSVVTCFLFSTLSAPGSHRAS